MRQTFKQKDWLLSLVTFFSLFQLSFPTENTCIVPIISQKKKKEICRQSLEIKELPWEITTEIHRIKISSRVTNKTSQFNVIISEIYQYILLATPRMKKETSTNLTSEMTKANNCNYYTSLTSGWSKPEIEFTKFNIN